MSTFGRQKPGKNEDSFSFQPNVLLIFSANESPRTGSPTAAYFGRWLHLPFPNTFGENETKALRLKALGSDRDEMEGFLFKAVQGLGRLLERGDFDIPESSQKADKRFRADTDSVSAMVQVYGTFTNDGGTTQSTEAWKFYKGFCEVADLKPLGRSHFYGRLATIEGIERRTARKDTLFFDGLRITDDAWEVLSAGRVLEFDQPE
jgi:putative DNA primase/helicase